MRTSICQIALSVTDRARSLQWYQHLGLVPSGSMGPVSGDVPARMLQLSECDFTLDWLDGRDPMVQMELFQFTRPSPKTKRANWTASCAGYGTVSFVVPDFEGMIARLIGSGAAYSITGERTHRSLWIRDPDGISVEIMEKDPLNLQPAKGGGTGAAASIRGISLTVANLEKAKRYFIDTVQFVECAVDEFGFNAHPPDVDPAKTEWKQTVARGGNTLLRLLEPSTSEIIDRPPGYQLSDIGVLNIAVIVETAEEFAALQKRIKDGGYRFSADAPMVLSDYAGVIYGHDDQGNSIEVGFVTVGNEMHYGWHR
jgi:catechol 2,3-dioxygenase-like lactoylglutathione lyase family enzyme